MMKFHEVSIQNQKGETKHFNVLVVLVFQNNSLAILST